MAELLRLEGLCAGHGAARTLFDVDLAMEEGASLALLGRNGVGKTTLVEAIVGVVTRHAGRVILAGRDVTGLPPHARAMAGVGWVPQERNVFRSLSVEENLTAVAIPGPWTPARIYETFPRLAERRRNGGRQLSGGEQQMLAIGRALVLNPRLLLLDEPTEGLAPIVVDELLGALRRLAREGLAMIVVEQKPRKILAFTDQAAILDRGRIVHRAASADLAADEATLGAHLSATR
ncbi:MAG: ABC transporter ATP-binding protein [Hyphomicrobiales bacterium]|nr:ABC transporter ATP-binding protein [Hyphomicrobiales bacterium]MDE2017442.1 ABC transporter ATP-binding protein [Hyphomicrobiales bacterium]